MTEFTYKGRNLRMDEWHTDDYSDDMRGTVQLETVRYGWLDLIEYRGFEGNASLSGLDTTEHYTDFNFDAESVVAFLDRNAAGVEVG